MFFKNLKLIEAIFYNNKISFIITKFIHIVPHARTPFTGFDIMLVIWHVIYFIYGLNIFVIHKYPMKAQLDCF